MPDAIFLEILSICSFQDKFSSIFKPRDLTQSTRLIGVSLIVTLDFSSLLKNHYECSSVSWESSFQSSEISSEVRSVVRLEIGVL